MRVAQALQALDAIAPLPAVTQATHRALHRVLARPALAACDLPPFAQSAVDGYALRHADLDSVAGLPLGGIVRAGTLAAAPRLAPGTAQRIFTGGMLPAGADTVARQEWVEAGGGALKVLRPLSPGADVRQQGEELRRGATLALAGTRLTPGLLAALAMAGVAKLSVRPAPRISVLVTGDEVVPPGGAPKLGQIFDANGPLVASWLAARGYGDVRVRYVGDSATAVRRALAAAFGASDLVLSTGGVSVGDHDYVPRMAQKLGATPLFWKVAQKPGKPVFAALRGGVPLLGLPGNPASVLVNLLVYARRALDRLEGVAEPGPQFAAGILDTETSADAERDQWLRVAVRAGPEGCVRLGRLPKQGSHMLSNLAQAGGLAWIPAAPTATPAGTVVRWLAL